MPLKVLEATLSTFDGEFEKFKAEASNNKANLILFWLIKTLPPLVLGALIDPDWYYVRTASMARKIYLRAGIGVGRFCRIYGGSKRNGSRPPDFGKSSGSVARHILQQLQAMNIVDFNPKGGRRITSSGQRDLDQVDERIVVTH